MALWLGSLCCFGPCVVFFAARFENPALIGISVAAAIIAAALTAVFASPLSRLDAAAWVIWNVTASLWAWFECDKNLRRKKEQKFALMDLGLRLSSSVEELSRLKIENAEVDKEQKRSRALYGAVKSLTQALGWDDTKAILESAVEQYLGASGYSFYAALSKESFETLICRGLHASPGASYAALERCLAEHSLSLSGPRLLETPEEAVVVPVRDREEGLGIFYARVPHGVQGREFLARCAGFIDEIAFVFRRLRLFQEVDNLSRIDGLTGTHRRGELEERLNHEVVRARTFKTSLGLLMLDIDHFKLLNDRWGHPFGDQVLRRVGEILNTSVYETDFVARYGGEEFVVILPRADFSGALRKAELIRRAIESEKFVSAFEAVAVTVSIGLAHFPRDAAGPEDLLARADAALYEAKSRGRNRVLDFGDVKSRK